MSSFRFIHAADIHLDSPLQGLTGDDETIAHKLRLATREALTALVDAALERRVDFMLIAGDVYDGDWPDYHTGIFFSREMHRLQAADIPVFLIHGNHDAQNNMTRELSLPDNVTVFSHEHAESRRLETLGVTVHGLSYGQRRVTDNLVPSYPPAAAGDFNIGVLHTGLGGRGGHANYAPCALEELVAKGYDYWALGHVHRAEVLHEHPHVVFSGNLQGRSIRETGAKSAYEVGVVDGRVTELAPIHCDVARWARIIPAGIDEAASLTDVFVAMRRAIEFVVNEQADGRLLACRLILMDTTELHNRLVAAPERLLAEARAAAAGLVDAQVYVQKVEVKTCPPSYNAAARRNAAGEIQRLLEHAAEDPDLIAMLKKDVRRMAEGLPAEIRTSEDPLLTAAIAGEYEALIAQASQYLLARLDADPDPA